MWWQVGSGIYSFVVITLLAVVALAFIIGFTKKKMPNGGNF